jgi:hypothetical protein
MWKQFATPAENDYDDMVARHKDGECIEDCPLCGEEDYQRDMYERRLDAIGKRTVEKMDAAIVALTAFENAFTKLFGQR